MRTPALATSIEDLRCLLDEVQATTGDAAAPGPTGGQVRQMFALAAELVAALRGHLAQDNDPRLALEMATASRALAAEATRLSLVAAERISATAANTLAQDELDALRQRPADTGTEPLRATGRPSYKNPAELLASWTATPYTQANRQLLDAQDLIARRDMAGQRVPPRFQHLGDHFLDPTYDPAAVREISQKLARVEPADTTFDGMPCTPTLHHADGRTLEEHAAEALAQEFTPSAAAKKVDTLIARAADDPGTATAASRRRGLFKLPERNRYYRQYLLRVTTLEGALIDSLVAQANNPRTQAGKAARVNPEEPAAQPGSAFTPGMPPSPAAGQNGDGSAPHRDDVPDFLPDGAEAARWDEDQFQLPEASPPERALNALLDLVQYDHDVPASVKPQERAAAPGQDSLFDTDSSADATDVRVDDGDFVVDDLDPLNQDQMAHDGQQQLADGSDPGREAGGVHCPDRSAEYLDELASRSDVTRLGNRKQRRSKRIRPLLVAHMYIENLQQIAAAHAETQHGVQLPPAALRQLACEADVIAAVFNAEGALLDFGRRLRLVPDILQKAVLARDRYCIVPGCTRPVEHLEFHHVIPYSEGGQTNLENIVPACRTHHIELDLGLIQVIWRRAVPWVLLPADRDPQQRLRRNYVHPGMPTSLPLRDTG